MPHIKNKLILRSIIYIMKAYHEFDSTEAGTEVAWIDRAAFDHIATDLIAKLTKRFHIHRFYVSRGIDLFKKLI